MTTDLVPLIFAAVAAIALVLALYALRPARPDVEEILSRLDARRLDLDDVDAEELRQAAKTATFKAKLGGQLQRAIAIKVPEADLKLLGHSPAEHLGHRMLMALLGLLFPQMLHVLLLAGGLSLFPLWAGTSLAFAALMWWWSGKEIQAEARKLRHKYTWAIASYMERVALARLAGSAPDPALIKTAEVGDSHIFIRIAAVLEQSKRSTLTSWAALKRLSEEIQVPELGRPADTIALAGDDGASVNTTLNKQAKALRGALVKDAKAKDNASSTLMALPLVLLLLVMCAFILYPAVVTILGT